MISPATKQHLDDMLEELKWDSNRERIACSAIWFQDGQHHPHQPKGIELGFVIYGLGHHHCFATAAALNAQGLKDMDSEQGFMTTEGRFVDRKEAVGIARMCGQLDKWKSELFSEDIFYRQKLASARVAQGIGGAAESRSDEGGRERSGPPQSPVAVISDAPKNNAVQQQALPTLE